MDWIRKRWWVALLYVANLAVAAIAENIVDDAFNDPTFHDVVLATVVIVAVAGPIIYLIVAEVGSSAARTDASRAAAGAHVHETNSPPSQAREEQPVTGETLISTVTSNWRFKASDLDY